MYVTTRPVAILAGRKVLLQCHGARGILFVHWSGVEVVVISALTITCAISISAGVKRLRTIPFYGILVYIPASQYRSSKTFKGNGDVERMPKSENVSFHLALSSDEANAHGGWHDCTARTAHGLSETGEPRVRGTFVMLTVNKSLWIWGEVGT